MTVRFKNPKSGRIRHVKDEDVARYEALGWVRLDRQQVRDIRAESSRLADLGFTGSPTQALAGKRAATKAAHSKKAISVEEQYRIDTAAAMAAKWERDFAAKGEEMEDKDTMYYFEKARDVDPVVIGSESPPLVPDIGVGLDAAAKSLLLLGIAYSFFKDYRN